MHRIEWRNATKRYPGRTALDGIDLAVPPGAGLGLLGPNGAGKTTAIRLLLGLANPTSGSVLLRGLPPSDATSRRRVGYLPERLALPERATVRSVLELHARLADLPPETRADEIDARLAQTGLVDRAADRVGSLSKGLRQRVGFAQALLGDPEVLLLDEPTSGLDPLGIRDARDWILAARARGCTVLVNAHGLSEVERTCDQIAILYEGRVARSGATADLVGENESLEDVFIRAVRG